MRKSWMALLLTALVGCGSSTSGADRQAQDAYHQALASCGTNDVAHSNALNQLIRLERAHPKDVTVADAFTKAWQYEAQYGC